MVAVDAVLGSGLGSGQTLVFHSFDIFIILAQYSYLRSYYC